MQQPALRFNRNPAVFTIIGLMAVCFVLSWFGLSDFFGPRLAFSGSILSQPWSLLTYPFASFGVGSGLLFFLLALMWLYWAGSSIENELGTRRFALVWVAATLAYALMAWVGSLVIRVPVALVGGFLPVSAITMLWCARNPAGRILLLAIFPVTGNILAAITAALVLFSMGDQHPALGFMMLVPTALFWAWAGNRLPIRWPASYGRATAETAKEKRRREARDREYIDAVKDRERERAERERLRKLFESSIEDES